MKFKLTVRQNQTFFERFNDNALWWGGPIICIEFFGVPLRGWKTWVTTVAAPLAVILATKTEAKSRRWAGCLDNSRGTKSKDRGRFPAFVCSLTGSPAHSFSFISYSTLTGL